MLLFVMTIRKDCKWVQLEMGTQNFLNMLMSDEIRWVITISETNFLFIKGGLGEPYFNWWLLTCVFNTCWLQGFCESFNARPISIPLFTPWKSKSSNDEIDSAKNKKSQMTPHPTMHPHKASSEVHSSQPFHDQTVSFLGWWRSTMVVPVPLCGQFWKWTNKFLLLQNQKSSFAQLGNAGVSAKHKHVAHLHGCTSTRAEFCKDSWVWSQNWLKVRWSKDIFNLLWAPKVNQKWPGVGPRLLEKYPSRDPKYDWVRAASLY